MIWMAPLVAAPRKAAPKSAASPPLAEAKLIQSCDAHKFETIVDATVNGQPHKSKVRLCGVQGQSDAEWIGTLQDAVRKLEADKSMAPATRDQIIAAIRGEIGRLSIVVAPASPPGPAAASAAPLAPLSRDYAALPPLPPAAEPVANPPPAEPTSRPQPVAAEPSAAPVSTPLPTPVSTPVAISVAVPHVTLNCETPGDLAGVAPCAEFERETRLTIGTDETVPAGTVLQFIRNGREQASLPLDGLGKGRPLRISLPQSICSGFGAGRLELLVVPPGGAQSTQSLGRYSLRC